MQVRFPGPAILAQIFQLAYPPPSISQGDWIPHSSFQLSLLDSKHVQCPGHQALSPRFMRTAAIRRILLNSLNPPFTTRASMNLGLPGS